MPRKPQTGIMLVKRVPTTTREQKAELQRKLRRSVLAQSDDGLAIPMLMFGSRVAAAEYVRRYRAACEREGRKYVRRHAISAAAKRFGLDENKLTNWLNRSKRARGG